MPRTCALESIPVSQGTMAVGNLHSEKTTDVDDRLKTFMLWGAVFGVVWLTNIVWRSGVLFMHWLRGMMILILKKREVGIRRCVPIIGKLYFSSLQQNLHAFLSL